MQPEPDVLIAGGGLNGPLLALALASGGVSSLVLDARPRADLARADFDGRAYALALSSRRMLEALDLWEEIAPKAEAILDIKVSDGRAGAGASPWFLHFDHHEIEEGPMGHFVEDRFLRAAILAGVARSPLIEHRLGTEGVGQEIAAGGVRLRLGDGSEARGRLLVGCDGQGSGTAARAGIGRIGWDYPQTALVAAVAHEHPHEGVAHQFFTP
ncbi:hypothetical protein BH23PSE1_BH23PSE1_16920 [soil metagenome]